MEFYLIKVSFDYLVQEYVEGCNLKEEVQQLGSYTEEEIKAFLREILPILSYIHGHEVIHRDIKPANILRRTQDRRLVLIDFGAVKKFNLEQTRILNPTIALGTYGYMPSEQAMGKPRKSSDIYAMGVIAIQALTGKNPTLLEEDENGEILWSNVVYVNGI